LVIVTTSAIGVLWNRYRFKEIANPKNPRYAEFYFFGLLVHVDMLLCMLLLPGDQIIYVLKNITFPVLVLYPLATYLLCKLLLIQFSKSDLAVQLRQREALLLSLLDSIPDLIFYKDMDGVYIGCNRPFCEFMGKPMEEIIGKTDFDLFDRQRADIFIFNDKETLKLKQPRRSEEWVVYPGGERVLLDTLKTPYCGVDGELIGTLGISRDITERNQKEEEISYIGYHDYLTGLNNRRCFEEKKKRLDAEEYLPLTAVFADMDGLKLINDGFGYANGDKLLIEAAEILKKCCRASDVVFRIGGDEFCILLPKASAETARKIVKRIRSMCDSTYIDLGGSSVRPSISMGYDTKIRAEQDFSDIIGNAENLMRRSKLLQRKNVRSDLLSTIKDTMLESSHESPEHAERLVKLALALGEELNLSEERLMKLELAAALHDIGTTSIDNNILSKQEELTQDDWAQIRKHPEAGYRIAQATSELMPISEYILSHHERWDGKGYPQGLKGEQIPLISRIITLVDSYDAMTEDRPYRSAMTQQEAISGILRNAGTQFDPKIVKIFIEKIVKPGKC
jgi:diguanylate cyclase (GGDEF)-like protein/PAS domain S-box-containing protein